MVFLSYYRHLPLLNCICCNIDAVIQNGSQLNNAMQSEHHLASIYIHNSVTIFGININVDVDKLSHRKLT